MHTTFQMTKTSRVETNADGSPKVYHTWIADKPERGIRCRDRNLPMLKGEAELFEHLIASRQSKDIQSTVTYEVKERAWHEIVAEQKKWEPLTAHEKSMWRNLKEVLRLDDALFSTLTQEQRFSAARVIVKQGSIRHPVATPGDYLGISFDHIFIGIEKDGYAHS